MAILLRRQTSASTGGLSFNLRVRGHASLAPAAADVPVRQEVEYSAVEAGALAAQGASFGQGGAGLCDEAAAALRAAGFERPTALQAHAIPEVLAGNDTVITAETGSGKTLAYLAPVLDLILHEVPPAAELDDESSPPVKPLALVIVPTKELVQQVSDVARGIFDSIGMRDLVCPVHGRCGPSPRSNTALLVATPQALANNVRTPLLSDIRVVVLDEADLLLSGSERDVLLDRLLTVRMRQGSTPVRPQVVFAAATLPSRGKKSVAAWIDKFFPDATLVRSDMLHRPLPQSVQRWVTIDVDDAAATAIKRRREGELVASLSDVGEGEEVEEVDPKRARLDGARRAIALYDELLLSARRRALLLALDVHGRDRSRSNAGMLPEVVLGNGRWATANTMEPSDIPRTLVFVNSLKSAKLAAKWLSEAMPLVSTAALHKHIPEEKREAAIAAFASAAEGDSDVRVLVCTDVASRGLDTVGAEHVVQLEFANDAVTFLHRCGRTGRAGTGGLVTNIVEARGPAAELAAAVRAALAAGEPLERAFSRRRSFRRNRKKKRVAAEAAALRVEQRD